MFRSFPNPLNMEPVVAGLRISQALLNKGDGLFYNIRLYGHDLKIIAGQIYLK